MSFSDSIRYFAATDVGRTRDHNEDNYLVDPRLGLCVVADGMGGHAAGEVASALAVRAVHEEVKRDRQLVDDFAAGDAAATKVGAKEILALLEFAVQRACQRIHDEALGDDRKRGMGTTLSALLVAGDTGFIAHVGDSRIYLMRAGQVQQITEDHTVYNELIKRGKLTRDQIDRVAQKNAITRAVGVYERVDVDTLTIDLVPGDQFLLASDGLHGYIAAPADLGPHLAVSDGDEATRRLIAFANDAGGKDNITAVVVRLGEGTGAEGDRALKIAQKRDVLAKMPIFARLAQREMLRVMQVADVRAYAPGVEIIREGDKGDELFIVLSGRVTVSRGGAVLTTLGPGEHVGEMSLIRSQPRSASVFADGATEMVVIRRSDFFDILRREHELAVKLLWQFLGVFADRLDQTSKDLKSARAELSAEDMTSEIFPDYEEIEPEPSTVRPEGLS